MKRIPCIPDILLVLYEWQCFFINYLIRCSGSKSYPAGLSGHLTQLTQFQIIRSRLKPRLKISIFFFKKGLRVTWNRDPTEKHNAPRRQQNVRVYQIWQVFPAGNGRCWWHIAQELHTTVSFLVSKSRFSKF